MQGDDRDQVMELMWLNGQVVVHQAPRPPQQQPPIYYIQEDEMASWLHQPIVHADPQFGNEFSSDLLYSSAPSALVTDLTIQASNHPQPNPRQATIRTDRDFRVQRFNHLSNFVSPGHSNTVRESVSVVESNVTPEKRASESVGDAGRSGFVAGGSSPVGGGDKVETLSFELTAGTATNASLAELDLEPLSNDLKKRKALEVDIIGCPSQDLAADTNKETQTPTAKRTRAVEVHNLSERRRRDRINEKMKALQELLPSCNKTDKASMLDDAFEYLKSLQMQVQMMFMGMVPMMFPGLQQYMQMLQMPMGSGIDMNQPRMPFHMTTPTHFTPRFPVPSYNPNPPFMPPNSPCIQVTNPISSTLHPDPYLSYQNPQMQPPQSGMKALSSAEAIYLRPCEGLQSPEKPLTG